MKKYYIIIANNITGMGGVHQYCRNKLQEVKRRGYQTCLYSGNYGTIFVPELREFKNNVHPELKYPPHCFSKKLMNEVVCSICTSLGEVANDSILECLTVAAGEWGELIAKKLKIKSLCFVLDEHTNVSLQESKFLKFKHDRLELATISKTCYKNLLRNCYQVRDDETHTIKAVCSNVLYDYDYNIPFTKNGTVIGSIGRLEKNYVIPMLKEIARYFVHKREKSFILVLVGGADSSKLLRKIKKMFLHIPNVSLYITGYIYPIPQKLIESFDVAISSAGSTKITALDADIPTISIDANNALPIGILNYTTTRSLYATEENDLTIEKLLDDILERKVCEKLNKRGMISPIDKFPEEIDRQFEVFVNSSIKKEYYDVSTIKPDSLQYKTYAIIGHLFGGGGLSLVHRKLIHPLKKLIQ